MDTNLLSTTLQRLNVASFNACIGLISLNGDGHVAAKLGVKAKDCRLVCKLQRIALVDMAIADKAWLQVCSGYHSTQLDELRRQWPFLVFCHFEMNGADDVVKYRKWRDKTHSGERLITMGRKGSMQLLEQGMRESGVEEDESFILGPVLPEVSSTDARAASRRGDRSALLELLHPDVADWLLADAHANAAQAQAAVLPPQGRQAGGEGIGGVGAGGVLRSAGTEGARGGGQVDEGEGARGGEEVARATSRHNRFSKGGVDM